MIRLVAIVAIGLWASVAQAADPHVTCVQQQLVALGRDPGPVDGLNGPRTRAALAAHLADIPEAERPGYNRLPAFSARAAVGWCREIGLRNPAARPMMPSTNPPELFVSDEVSAPMRVYLLTAFQEAERFFRDNHGIELASQVTLAAAVSPEEFRRQVRRTTEGRQVPAAQLRRSAQRNCEGDLGGSMFRHVLTLCGSLLAQEDEADSALLRRWMTAVMVHEYVHHIQRELSYDKVPRWVREGTKVRRRMGPAWMVEGTAQVLESRYLRPHRRHDRYQLYLMRVRAKAAGKSLSSIRRDDVVESAEAYLVSHYATELLARRYGDRSLFDFWAAVGETDNWYTAFEQVYGMSVSEFETLFETMVADNLSGFEFAGDRDMNGDGLVAGYRDLPPARGG